MAKAPKSEQTGKKAGTSASKTNEVQKWVERCKVGRWVRTHAATGQEEVVRTSQQSLSNC
jgi:hypothetical protein